MPLDRTNRQSIETLIATAHWEGKRSIRSLEREHGLSNGLLSLWCIRHGIAVRSKGDQMRITGREPTVIAKRSGARHWAWGMRAETSDRLRRQRERMTSANPVASFDVRCQAAESKSVTYRDALTPAERHLLVVFGDRPVPQHPVGPYIVDLAFVPELVAVEADGKGHSSAKRWAHDEARDAWLVAQGWRVLRINNPGAFRPHQLVAALKQLIPDVETPGLTPLKPGCRVYKCRVLLRDSQNPAGRKL